MTFASTHLCKYMHRLVQIHTLTHPKKKKKVEMDGVGEADCSHAQAPFEWLSENQEFTLRVLRQLRVCR